MQSTRHTNKPPTSVAYFEKRGASIKTPVLACFDPQWPSLIFVVAYFAVRIDSLYQSRGVIL
jgi:hypothetical protein